MFKNKNSSVNIINPFQNCRGYICIMLVISILSGVCSLVQIYSVSNFIDSASLLVSDKTWNIKTIIAFLVLAFTITVDWLTPRINSILEKKVQIIILQDYRPIVINKCARIKYEYFEDEEKWNLINRVCKEPEIQWTKFLSAFLALMRLIIKIGGIVIIIATNVWWASIIVLVFCVPIFIYSVKSGKKNYQAIRDASEYTRKHEYFDTVLRNKEYLEERKLFGYSNRIEKSYLNSFFNAFWIETKTAIQWALKTKLSGGLSMIAALIIVITLINPTVRGYMTLGMFMALVNAVFLLTGEMSWGLSRNIDSIVVGYEYKKDVSSFLDLQEDEGATDLPSYCRVDKIEFRNVRFRYPKAEYDTLNSISFVMERGKKYAFVGANGAGKTTIVKLLLGLYTDYSGQILINEKDIRSYGRAEQKGFYSAVFQDYIKHSLSIRENCTIADPKRIVNDAEIIELLKKFELDELVRELPDGLDTELGKINEKGVELSGGQWQKLAMVRALLRPSDVQIMDEPTAALDPKMESEIYRLFQSVSNEKLTLLISHRLGFSRFADEIFVIQDGIISESGKFDKLMSLNGVFAKMYEEQKKWYD